MQLQNKFPGNLSTTQHIHTEHRTHTEHIQNTHQDICTSDKEPVCMYVYVYVYVCVCVCVCVGVCLCLCVRLCVRKKKHARAHIYIGMQGDRQTEKKRCHIKLTGRQTDKQIKKWWSRGQPDFQTVNAGSRVEAFPRPDYLSLNNLVL